MFHVKQQILFHVKHYGNEVEMFNLFKKRVTVDSPRAEKFTYGEDLDNLDADELRNYTGDGVKIDRPLFAQTVEKHIKQTGVELDDEMLDMLTDYYEIVVRSNANINLTAITDPEEFAVKHIIDSLMLSPFLEEDTRNRLIDVGTGAGMPVIPLAITHPDHRFAMIDSQNKRFEFLKFVTLRVNVCNIHPGRMRAEEAGRLALYREQFEFATARAVAPLNILTEYCLPMVKMDGFFLAMKGDNFQEEIDNAKNAIFQLGGRLEDVQEYKLPSGEKRSIVIIKKVVPCRRDLPRRSAVIKKKPF